MLKLNLCVKNGKKIVSKENTDQTNYWKKSVPDLLDSMHIQIHFYNFFLEFVRKNVVINGQFQDSKFIVKVEGVI
jgi:hypothetical protein